MATRMQQRRGTAAEWTSVNPVLAAGEIGFETDTGKFKIGDGTNAWNSLTSYGTLDSIINAAPSTLDTLNELAQAVNDDPDFYTNITATITTAVTQLNASISSNRGDLEASISSNREEIEGNYTAAIANAVSDAVAEEEAARTIAINAAINAESTARSNAINAAIQVESEARGTAIEDAVSDLTGAYQEADNALSTSLSSAFGAADTALQTSLEAYADAAASSAQSSAVTSSNGYTDNEISDHNLATTNVHGIADTSALATTTDVSTAKQEAINAAAVASELYADGLAANYDPVGSASAAVSSHNFSTTSVHGIADTADLVTKSAATQTLSGDLVISGSLIVSGNTTTVSASELVISDPLVYMSDGQWDEDVVDIGFLGAYGVTGGTEQDHLHSGLFRDNSDSNKWKLISNVPHPVNNAVDLTNAEMDTLVVGTLEADSIVFSDGTQTKVGVPSITPIAQKTGSYTLGSLTERDTIVEMNSQSAMTLTIPADSSVNFPVGTTLDIIQTGTGQVTIAAGAGVTVNATPGLKLRTQWSSATLLKRAANTWLVFGDTAA